MPVQHVCVLGEKSEIENPFKFKNIINVSGKEAMTLVGKCGRLRLKCDGTRAETKFRLSRETDESI